jgi:hypothetical protein
MRPVSVRGQGSPSLAAPPSRVHRRARSLFRVGALVAALALAASAHAATYLVRPDGTGDFPTVQAALDAATGGDTVLLADGTFTGPGNRDLSFLGKAITLASQSGSAEACIIDCQGSAVAPHRGISAVTGEGSASLLSGVTVRNGFDPTAGGGLLCTDTAPTIVDCVFRECFGDMGGAVACRGTAAPSFSRCRFEADSAGIGAAIWAGDYATPSFDACVFSQNHAGIEAGGISLQYNASAVVRDCRFEDNVGTYRGGGLLADDYSIVDVTRSTFVANASTGGGGAYCCAFSLGYFRNCTFQENAAPQGAQLCCGCSGSATLENCILAFGHHGAGVYCWSSGEAHLTCSDVYGNAAGDWFGCIASQYGVDGNISEDPVFCDSQARDLTLHAGSPCLDGHHPMGGACGLIGAWGLGCPTEDAPEDAPSVAGWQLAVAGANPFAGSTWIACRVPDGTQAATLAVFDLAGRCVRALAPAGLAGGAHRIAWDGNDDLGRPVAAGVYYVRLGSPGPGLEQRVCRVR